MTNDERYLARQAIHWLVRSEAEGYVGADESSVVAQVGQWSGTTAQGASIAFMVSSDEALATLSVGYNFNGCSGTQAFTDLNVPTAPEVHCSPGPCSGTELTYRALSFQSGTPGDGPATNVTGVFLPGGRAQGLATFRDYPGCGTAGGVEWTATRR